ncbi:MAG: GBS Bsp-like repeat-containing protein [Lachnospiraceae bacterium]|nr:GBS Bsp-like repeat-containing protein [Lachnospiraceae bacterium]
MEKRTVRRICRLSSWIACLLLLLLCTVPVWAEGTLSAKLNTSETTCSITWSGYQMPSDGDSLQVAVWSSNKGQDDLKWRSLRSVNGAYSVDFSIADHKDSGEYNVHLYLHTKANKMVFLGKTSFTVTPASATEVSVTDLNQTAGTCNVVIKGLKSPSGITKVQVPTWCAADQSDLVWYEAAKQSDGSWIAKIDFSRHKSHLGTYQIHVYANSANGLFNIVGKTTTQYGVFDPAVTVSRNQADYTVKATAIKADEEIKAVRVAIWSKENGQDDLRWTDLSYTASSDSATAAISLEDYRDFGTYHAHVYAVGKSGKLYFQAKTEFELPVPKASVSVEQQSGKFNVRLSDVSCGVSIKQIMVAVWCAGDQSDIVWYKAEKQGDGSYTVSSDISKHKNHTGNYYVHAYMDDNRGSKSQCIAKSSFQTAEQKERSAGELKMTPNTDRSVYSASVSDVYIPESYASVQMAVWTENNGQDDLTWYKASENGSTCSADIPVSDHKNEEGLYHLHLYAKQADGKWLFIRKYTFEVTAAPTLKIVKKSASTAELSIKLAPDMIASRVEFPTWTTSNQSDLVWYQGVKQSDGSYTVMIDTAKHENHSGTYIIHAYYIDNGGTHHLLSKGTVDLVGAASTTNKLTITKNSDSTATVSIKPAATNMAKVLFPTWCASDQSDIVWYQGTKQSDGSYKATIDAVKHQYHSGTYIVHAYMEDAAGKKTFLDKGTVDLKADAPAVMGTASIRSCLITGGNQVTVEAAVTGSGSFGLFRLPAGQTDLAAGATPLATTTGSGIIRMSCPLNVNTSSSLINEKLVIGQKQGSSYVKISSGSYITNPEAVASITRAFPTAASKKGLQVNTGMASDARALGVNHAVINVVLSNIPSKSGGIPYNYNGKTYYMDMGYVYALDAAFAEQAANGSIVSAILLLPWDNNWINLIIPSGRTAGHAFYGVNAETQSGRDQLGAIFSFLANRYSDSGHNVVNWILGNEVGNYTTYNWCGNVSLQQYAEYLAHAFRLLYNSTRSQYSNARSYISLDHVWNYPRTGAFKGLELVQAFANAIQAEGDITWNIAYHPYPAPLTSPNFWKNTTGCTFSPTSYFFTMYNLRALTDYIANTYGSQHRFILSETGFTSYSGGVHDEKLQAAAIAYGYYLAEFNDMVDSFVIHRHVDHIAETSQGLYLGLWTRDPATDGSPLNQKMSWSVFKNMDTSQGAAYTNFALSVIGANSWESIVPGYTASRFR